jgi:hypothetical protein
MNLNEEVVFNNLELLSPFSSLMFLLFFLYLLYSIIKRSLNLNQNVIISISLYLFFVLLFSFFFLNELLLFNNTYNFGSDSRIFSEVVKDLASHNYDNPLIFTLFYDSKWFHAILLSGLGQLISNSKYFDFYVYGLNIIIHLLVLVNFINIWKWTYPEEFVLNKFKLKLLIWGNILSFLVLLTWFRDSWILLVISELILLFAKRTNFRKLKIFLNLSFLFFLRNFLVLPFLFFSNRRFKNSYKRLFLLCVFVVILITFLNPSLMNGLLSLQGEEELYENSLGGSLVFSASDIESGKFDIFFTFKVIFRMCIGFIKFIMSPLFVKMLFGADSASAIHGKEFYAGFLYQIIIILNSFLHNFLIMPLFFGSVYSAFKRNWKVNPIVIFTFNILLFFAFFYALKFIGTRNFRIDYIWNQLIIFTIVLLPIRFNIAFKITLLIFIFLNILSFLF